MPFTEDEKHRIRAHLGYVEVQPVNSIQLGIARPTYTVFIIEHAMNNLAPSAEPRVRTILQTLDDIECRMVKWLDQLRVESVDSTKLRSDATDALEHEYDRWSARLADIFGVERYAYSKRWSAGATVRNVTVG